MATKIICDICEREITPGEITPAFAKYGKFDIEISVMAISVTDYQVGSGEKYERPLQGEVCSDCTLKVIESIKASG